MKFNYFMPARVIMGRDCVRENAALLKNLGKKAFIVTGRSSAKENGSLDDSLAALKGCGQESVLFNKAAPNPQVEDAYKAAEELRRSGCDFVLAIGGGSAIDLGKAAAALAYNAPSSDVLFATALTSALPVAAVPTTAGTGSEVTHYALLMNAKMESKSSLTSTLIFPRLAFLDVRYTVNLNHTITVNTAVDALSHCIEGLLSTRSSPLSECSALSGIRLFAECLPALRAGRYDFEVREKLLLAALSGGMVIANTGTIIVHGAGYALTYFKHIDHGRANGLLLGAYLRFVFKKEPQRLMPVLTAMNMRGIDEFENALNTLLGKRETLTGGEITDFAERAYKTPHINSSVVRPEKSDLIEMFKRSFSVQ